MDAWASVCLHLTLGVKRGEITEPFEAPGIATKVDSKTLESMRELSLLQDMNAMKLIELITATSGFRKPHPQHFQSGLRLNVATL